MDNQPKTRQEKGKGKGAKSKDAFNKKTIRIKEANLALAVKRK
jgi:hypothetical protein